MIAHSAVLRQTGSRLLTYWFEGGSREEEVPETDPSVYLPIWLWDCIAWHAVPVKPLELITYPTRISRCELEVQDPVTALITIIDTSSISQQQQRFPVFAGHLVEAGDKRTICEIASGPSLILDSRL